MKSNYLRIALVTERTRSYGRALCEGVAAYAQRKGDWSLELVEPAATVPGDGFFETYDGMIARIFSEPTAKRIAASGIPAVDIFGGAGAWGVPTIDCDHAAIAKLAARHFLARQFHSFAFCGYDGAHFSDRRKEVFVRYLAHTRHKCILYKAPKEVLARYACGVGANDRLGFDGDTQTLRKFLKSLPRQTALFCANDIRASQALRLCREEGISVPEDIAILGVDNDTLLCSFTTPAITSIDPNAFGVGYAAAEMLDGLLTRAAASPSTRARSEGAAATQPPNRIKPKGVVTRLSSEIYPLEPAWISDALTFIHRNVSRNLSASDVFQHLKLSHTIVEQTFRKTLGTTVQKEIIKSRMDEARHLLATSDLTIMDVARRAGFSSAEYFCRTFVAQHAKSPGEWRKVHRSE